MNKHAGVKKIIADSAVVASSEREPRTLNLALQGGGAHGAFTWGVLDRLLDEPKLSLEGVVATSAGAMNAAVLAYGLAEGGRSGRRPRSPISGGASAMRRHPGLCSRRSSTR